MDLSQAMASNLDEITKFFTTKMAEYDEKIMKLASSSSVGVVDINTLSQDFANFKNLVWKALSLIKNQTELLSLSVERHEAFLRRNVLLIHGIPEDLHETLISKVTSIFINQMSMAEFSNCSIEVCHRLGTHKGKARPVLVRFRELHQKELVWANKTSLKGSGLTISEFLTKSKHHLFMEARKVFGVNKCWSSNSKIIVMLPDNNRVTIEQMADLRKLILKHPSQDSEVTKVTSPVIRTEVPLIKSPRKPRHKK